ncbi:MAG: hypothetical protein ACI8ZB_002363 [Desulforhopalus sp.]|jgi:hypothetical protein
MNSEQTEKIAETKPTQRIPWWVSIIGAIATYGMLKYVLPEIAWGNQGLNDFFQLAPVAAPVLTIPFLLLAAKQLYDTDLPEEKSKDNRDDT